MLCTSSFYEDIVNIEQKDEKIDFGAASQAALQKDPETYDAMDIADAKSSNYRKELLRAVVDGKQKFSGDFFVAVLTKRERLLKNIIRNYFISRMTCPTPDYDQAVYHYVKEDDELHFLWTIPDRDVCRHIKNNPLDEFIDRELVKHVLDFADGTLAKKATKLNNEDKLEGKVILREVQDEQ